MPRTLTEKLVVAKVGKVLSNFVCIFLGILALEILAQMPSRRSRRSMSAMKFADAWA